MVGMLHRDTMDAALSGERAMLQAAVAGRYTVENEIGRGGMGIVYRARDLALERPVAIKLLPPDLAAHDELRERFLREARTAAGLAHPHIVPIHLVEAHDDVVFFVMSFVDGETLSSRVRRVGALPPLEVARVIQQVARALGYAHRRGVVHRDVKPDNILIEHGTARTFVTDFGIARRSDAAALTREGVVLGTAQFMSPEQAAGEAIDGRSDIYALGVVAYFALTGRPPFDAPTMQATLAMHLTQAPQPIATLRADLPRQLIDAVDRCLAKDAADRFQTADELVVALDTLVTPTADIAPLVRNWLRVAEQWLVVVWVLGINGFLLAVMEPQLAGMVVLFAVASVLGISVDLVVRTRQLLREGYTHEDVRFASLLERRYRERELQSVLGDDVALARRRRMVMTAMQVAAAGVAGIVLFAVLKRVAPGVPSAVVTVGGFGAVIAFTLGAVLALTSSARMQRSNLFYYSAVWRRWFGRWLFLAAAMGIRRARFAPSTSASGAALAADVAKHVPPADRAILDDAADLFDRLAERAAELLMRERELDRALAEAGAVALPESRVGASTRSTTDGEGYATLPNDALLERRSSGLEQLRAARDGMAHQRATLQIAGDNLRIQLLRLRARTGSVRDLEHDVAAARDVLER